MARKPRTRRSKKSHYDEPSRAEKKAQTRAQLVEAALELTKEVGGFNNISIRELTKKVGITPNAFYRHFQNIDELGLELVDQVGLSLRKIIREGRQTKFTGKQMIRQSLEIYVNFIEQNRDHFIFALQSRTGGSKIIQTAIRSEFRFFTLELANDLSAMRLLPEISSQDMEMMAELVVNTVAFGTVDLLDENISPQLREEVINTTEKQMRLIFLGTANWKSK